MKVKFNPSSIRRAVTLTAVAASMPILMATSAHAVVPAPVLLPLGCTAIVGTPVQISDDFWTHANRVRATVAVTCPGLRVASVDQRVYEKTAAGLTELGRTTHTDVFAFPGTQSDSLNVSVPNTPGDERVLQRVRVTVFAPHKPDGVQSGWITSGSVLVS